MSGTTEPGDPRTIHPLLLIGLYAYPLVFVRSLFCKGYARSTRRAVFIYGLTPIVLIFLVGLIDWLIRP